MSLFKMALENQLIENELDDSEEYIAFDLDGTTAYYDGWKGIEHIGEPIEKTVRMIKAFLAKGAKVKFLTARVATADAAERRRAREVIAAWSKEHIGQELEATCIKGRMMVRQYDDRARQVIENEGDVVLP